MHSERPSFTVSRGRCGNRADGGESFRSAPTALQPTPASRAGCHLSPPLAVPDVCPLPAASGLPAAWPQSRHSPSAQLPSVSRLNSVRAPWWRLSAAQSCDTTASFPRGVSLRHGQLLARVSGGPPVTALPGRTESCQTTAVGKDLSASRTARRPADSSRREGWASTGGLWAVWKPQGGRSLQESVPPGTRQVACTCAETRCDDHCCYTPRTAVRFLYRCTNIFLSRDTNARRRTLAPLTARTAIEAQSCARVTRRPAGSSSICPPPEPYS